MIPQGSKEWKQQRLGCVTASRVCDVVARTKSGSWGASRANYLAELLVERLTGIPYEGYTNQAMQWGIDTEPKARLTYELLRDCEVVAAPFVPHPKIARAGASPDGFVGDDGLLEAKCPLSSTHIETLLTGMIPAKYIDQMYWQMSCADRQWTDFISFDPRLPPAMQLFVKRLPRNQTRINELEKLVIEFLRELDAKEAELRSRYETDKAA